MHEDEYHVLADDLDLIESINKKTVEIEFVRNSVLTRFFLLPFFFLRKRDIEKKEGLIQIPTSYASLMRKKRT